MNLFTVCDTYCIVTSTVYFEIENEMVLGEYVAVDSTLHIRNRLRVKFSVNRNNSLTFEETS